MRIKNKHILNTISIIITIFTLLFFSFNQNNNKLITIVPIFFTIIYVLIMPDPKKLGLGYIVITTVWFIRYLVTPLLESLTNLPFSKYGEYNQSNTILIMLIEMIISMASLYIFFKLNKDKNKKIKNVEKNINSNLKSKSIFIILIIMILMIVWEPIVVTNYNFILSTNFNVDENPNISFQFLFNIFDFLKYILTVHLIVYFSKIKILKSDNIKFILSLMVIILSSIFVRGFSRSLLLIVTVTYMYILIRTYPKKTKISILFLFSLTITIQGILTIYRLFYNQNPVSNMDFLFIKNYVSSYFSGFNNISYGIETLNIYGDKYSFQTILKDLFGNTVFVNKFFTETKGTVYYFNYTFYEHDKWADQITPLITQSLGLFKFLGFLVPAIIMNLIVKLDLKSKSSIDVLTIFITTLTTLYLAFYSHGNLTIIATFINNTIIPMYIIILLLSFFSKKQIYKVRE